MHRLVIWFIVPFLCQNSIALFPNHGYSKVQSHKEIIWLKWISLQNKINIKHTQNGGQKKLTISNQLFSLDGYCEEDQTAYEFHGCFYHGCPKCFTSQTIHPLKLESMGNITKTGGLLTDYVNTFYKIMQESKGYPSWVKTEDEENIYIKNLKLKEGIILTKNNISKNEGIRMVAKLMLNS